MALLEIFTLRLLIPTASAWEEYVDKECNLPSKVDDVNAPDT